MQTTIRYAGPDDAQAMCALLNPIIAEGSTTAHRSLFDADRMIAHYIAPPRRVASVTAWEGSRLLGFQVLERPDPEWDGWGAVPVDWGLIASFVAREAQGRGIGTELFHTTRDAARRAAIAAIDATIRADNVAGLAYYSRLGFIDYDRVEGVPLSDGTPVDRIRKRYAIKPQV